MTDDEYIAMDMVGISALITAREISAEEALAAAIAREARVNPSINAIARPLHEEARAAIASGLPEGSLQGAPYLLKDVGAQMRGVPTTHGARLGSEAPARPGATARSSLGGGARAS